MSAQLLTFFLNDFCSILGSMLFGTENHMASNSQSFLLWTLEISRPTLARAVSVLLKTPVSSGGVPDNYPEMVEQETLAALATDVPCLVSLNHVFCYF